MNDEIVNFVIPSERTNQFIIERLIEIEATQILINKNVKTLLGLKRNSIDGCSFEDFLKESEDDLRQIRLELVAAFIKKYQ